MSNTPALPTRVEQEEQSRGAWAEAMSSITAESSTQDVFDAAARITNAKRSHVLQASRELYQEGARFKVVHPGARLEGLVIFGETVWSGWSRPLALGEVVTCTGWGTAWNRPGMLVAHFTTRDVPDNAEWVSVWPHAGLFLPYPLPGLLEPTNEVG